MSERRARPPECEQTQDQNQRPLQHALQSQQRARGKEAAHESGTRKGRPASAPYNPRTATLGKRGSPTAKRDAKGPADSSDTS